MVHVHGARVQRLSARTRGVSLERLVAVPVDVGKSTATAMACDFAGQVVVPPFGFALNLSGVAELVAASRCGWRPRPGWCGSGWRPPVTTTAR